MSQKDEFPEITPEFKPEFSRTVDVTSFGSKGRYFKFQSTEEENSDLASRYSILGVDNLNIECKITPMKKRSYRLNVTFSASIIQECGISLDPLKEKISGEFKITLQQGLRPKRKESDEINFTHDEEDTEFLETNLIDVGEMTAQHLSLEINPYPRKKDVTGDELGQKIVKEEDMLLEEEKKNPFAVLKSLKHKT